MRVSARRLSASFTAANTWLEFERVVVMRIEFEAVEKGGAVRPLAATLSKTAASHGDCNS